MTLKNVTIKLIQMKNLKFYKLIVLIFAITFSVSCVQDDDYDVPNLEVNPPVLSGTQVTIGALKQLLLQEQTNNGNALLTIEDDLYTTGYVISNDESGNLYEELILQDEKENPTDGVKLLVDVSPLFIHYEFGRKTHIQLQGLTVGFDSGVFTIGVRSGNNIENIGLSQMAAKVKRDVEVGEITPLPMSISDFDEDKTNLYVRLNDVQFNRNEVLGEGHKTYSAEPGDDFDGERALESCEDGISVVFSTSTFADFSAVLLPQGRGTLDGILTFNYFGDTFNMIVNSPASINFDNEDRCDPDFFFCTTPSGGGAAFYSESFEDFDSIEDYVDAGWTNANVSSGNTVWEIGNFNNSNYAQISGFSSGENEIDVWLVTPSINMDNTTKEELLFDIQSSYDNGTILSVLISSDFTGDVTTATWEILDASIPVGPSGGFGDFEPVGPINISCVDGTVNIAFVYEGSDPSATTRYHVDNIQVTGI